MTPGQMLHGQMSLLELSLIKKEEPTLHLVCLKSDMWVGGWMVRWVGSYRK